METFNPVSGVSALNESDEAFWILNAEPGETYQSVLTLNPINYDDPYFGQLTPYDGYTVCFEGGEVLTLDYPAVTNPPDRGKNWAMRVLLISLTNPVGLTVTLRTNAWDTGALDITRVVDFTDLNGAPRLGFIEFTHDDLASMGWVGFDWSSGPRLIIEKDGVLANIAALVACVIQVADPDPKSVTVPVIGMAQEAVGTLRVRRQRFDRSVMMKLAADGPKE